MNQKLLKTLEQPNEAAMQELLQRAYLPRRPSTFEEALYQAKLRQQGRRRALVWCASLAVVSSLLYAYWPAARSTKIEAVRLTPVAVEAPENASKPAASLVPAPQKLGSVYGVFQLITQKEGPLLAPTRLDFTPLSGLRVENDGALTEYKTPLLEPGIPLSAGAHYFVFWAEDGENYGPYWIEIEEGKALHHDFTVNRVPRHPLILDGKEVSFDATTPSVHKATKTAATDGELVVNTFPLIGLTVMIDGKSTGRKTPVSAPGISLSAGGHQVDFIGPFGEKHGPYWVVMTAGEVTRHRMDLRETKTRMEDAVLPLDGVINLEATLTKKGEGFLVVDSSGVPGLWVFVDGKKTRYQTPVADPGIKLSAGQHTIDFEDDTGLNYASQTIEIKAGETRRASFALKKSALEKAELRGKTIPVLPK
jgi:hypothetical protein